MICFVTAFPGGGGTCIQSGYHTQVQKQKSGFHREPHTARVIFRVSITGKNQEKEYVLLG